MNDKIEISTNNYEIDPNLFESQFTNRTIEFLKENNLVSNDLLNKAYNSNDKIWHNNDYFNCTRNQYGLQIAFNPNRIMDVKPTEQLSYEALKESFDIIENSLFEVGIKVNLAKQLIYRFHNSFDITTDCLYNEYVSLIRAFLPLKAKLRYNENFSIENTLYKLLSKQQKIVVYDKTKLYNAMNPNEKLSSEIMRFEYRNEKQAKEKRFSLSGITKDRYYKLRSEHKEIIRENIFNRFEIATDSGINLLLELLSNNVAFNEILKYLSSYLLNTELQKSNLDLIELLRSYVDGSNESYKKAIRRFISTINNHSIFDCKLNKHLYTELLYKFNKVA
mgnify:CR=1 FL=1